MNDVPPVRDLDASEVDEARGLLREYAASLGFPLDFQDFEREVEELPGAYAPPRGALLVVGDGRLDGCVGLRPLDARTCELKRLYVRPGRRGHGLGRRLATAAVARARALGYERMRLDTVPGMETALALYLELGFRPIAPYRRNPIPGARFLELEL